MITRTQKCPICGEPVDSENEWCAYCGVSYGPPTRESVFDEQVDLSRMPADALDDFAVAYLSGAELMGAQLGGVDLFDANLIAADLRGADLGGANLSDADLSGADLGGANLYGTDLSAANLCGAQLREANLTGANLVGAQYDGLTVWPDGFDPKAAGAISLVEEV